MKGGRGEEEQQWGRGRMRRGEKRRKGSLPIKMGVKHSPKEKKDPLLTNPASLICSLSRLMYDINSIFQ